MPIVLNGTFGSIGTFRGQEVGSVLRSMHPASGDREPTISMVRIPLFPSLKPMEDKFPRISEFADLPGRMSTWSSDSSPSKPLTGRAAG